LSHSQNTTERNEWKWTAATKAMTDLQRM